MGRYDLSALKVLRTADLQLRTRQLRHAPSWYDAVTNIPPSAALVRTPSIQHTESRSTRQRRKPRRASRMYQPIAISYEEDQLRSQFFGDHPWELARPRIVLEEDGKDAQRIDWSHRTQQGRRIDGESVVQRQLHLLSKPLAPGESRMTSAQAYDQARKEFYTLRHAQDIERRVAREEALSTGAYFELNPLEVGMELENKAFNEWKEWATQMATELEQSRSSAYSGTAAESGPSIDPDEASSALDETILAIEQGANEEPAREVRQ